MKNNNNNNYLCYKMFLFILSILFINSIKNNKQFNDLIYNYYSSNQNEYINIELDKFISGNITEDSIDYYNLSLLNDSEQIFFDYQSENGCLYIYINKNDYFNSSDYDFIFCSETIDNFFSLNKIDIIDKIDEEGRDSIKNLSLIIGVGHSNTEINKNEFIYSLKISLKKNGINIFEINSEHKILCKTEKINESNKCLFIINYNNDDIEKQDKNIIIYATPQIQTNKLNIYSYFINKEYYDNWNNEYLINNIPNINSNFTNYNSEQEFIYIPFPESNKYIYISIESNIESTIEIYSHIFYKNENIQIPNINKMKLYHINNNNPFFLDFNSLEIKDISISLATLNGKSNIYWEYDKSMKYISDIRENKLIFNLNKELCLNKCKLIINNLEYNEKSNENELGYIFYIVYEQKNYDNNINEIIYGKSIKLTYDTIKFPIMLYSQIPNISSPINVNLQFYNISEIDSVIINDNFLDIKAIILSTKELYQLKKNCSNIKLDNSITGKFDSSLFASNIYLSVENMEKFEIKENPWIFIYISSNIKNKDYKIILGSTLSQINSLIYPSERIYHYGELINEKKVIYKLGGKLECHLMRLEIGFNKDDIGWSVRRKINNDSFIYNDTDLSFIIERYYNGKSILTIYIERGEDIYLTIFNKNEISDSINYIFKYVNAAKNSDLKNYNIKEDSLYYDKNMTNVNVSQINNISSYIINYYLKIIEQKNYINNERINSIAIKHSSSNININIKGIIKDNKIFFDLKNKINNKDVYYMNVYSQIIGEDFDIEYISYNSIVINILENENNESNSLITIILICFIVFIFLLLCGISICIYIKKKNNDSLIEKINRINFGTLEYDNISDNDYLL